MDTHVSRGTYGDFSPRHGDLTGARHMANLEAKADRETAINNTKNDLVEMPLVIVHGPGKQVWAVPRDAYQAILAIAERTRR